MEERLHREDEHASITKDSINNPAGVNGSADGEREVDGDTLRQMLAAAHAIYEALHADLQDSSCIKEPLSGGSVTERDAASSAEGLQSAAATAAVSWQQFIQRNLMRLAGRITERDEGIALESLIRDGTYDEIVQAACTIRRFVQYVGSRDAVSGLFAHSTDRVDSSSKDNGNTSEEDSTDAQHLIPGLFKWEYQGCSFRSREVEAAVASSIVSKVLVFIRKEHRVDEEIIYLLGRVLSPTTRFAVVKAIMHELKSNTTDALSVSFFIAEVIRFHNNHLPGYLGIQANLEQLLESLLKRMAVFVMDADRAYLLTSEIFRAAFELIQCSLTSGISILYGCVGKALMVTHFCHEYRQYAPATLMLAFLYRHSIPYRPDFKYEFPADQNKAEDLLSVSVESIAHDVAHQQDAMILYCRGIINFKGLDSFMEEPTDVHGNRIVQFSADEEKGFKDAAEYFRRASIRDHAAAQCCLGFCYEIGRGVNVDMSQALHYYRLAAAQGNPDAQCYVGDYYAYGSEDEKDYDKAVHWYSKACQQGFCEAQNNLAICYTHGRGVPQNHDLALQYYRKAAEQGSPTLQYNLGTHYQNGCENGDVNIPEAMKWFLRAGEQNHGGALHALAHIYHNGIGIKADPNKAIKYYRLSALAGYGPAEYKYGACYATGVGVAKDPVEAVRWYEKAAAKSQNDAMNSLGVCYASGTGVEKNNESAVQWVRRAADQGYGNAQYNLAVWYSKGNLVKQDHDAAAELFQKAASQGIASAQYSAGMYCKHGLGGPKDEAAAVEYFRSAAEQSEPSAQVQLAVCYMQGKGVEKNPEQGVYWYRRAAESGNAKAQCYLGYYYSLGKGIEKDEEQAAVWYRRAADQGYAEAQNLLAVCYKNGTGVEKDELRAASWMRRAAEQGNVNAQYNIGYWFAIGFGVQENQERAVAWYRHAAQQGHVNAQLALGSRYEQGNGVAQDYEQAAAWYRLASAQGSHEAQQRLDEMDSNKSWFFW